MSLKKQVFLITSSCAFVPGHVLFSYLFMQSIHLAGHGPFPPLIGKIDGDRSSTNHYLPPAKWQWKAAFSGRGGNVYLLTDKSNGRDSLGVTTCECVCVCVWIPDIKRLSRRAGPYTQERVGGGCWKERISKRCGRKALQYIHYSSICRGCLTKCHFSRWIRKKTM